MCRSARCPGLASRAPGSRETRTGTPSTTAGTGIAAIAALKERIPTVRVWPFEDLVGASLVLAEIWPRLALGALAKSDPTARRRHVRELGHRGIHLRPEHEQVAAASDHAIDALAAAVMMASGHWPLPGSGALPRESAREGWILGVELSFATRPV